MTPSGARRRPAAPHPERLAPVLPATPVGRRVPSQKSWNRARKRLEARRKLVSDLVSYWVINAFLVFVWLIAGAGYFWPGWVIAGWGIGLAHHTWEVFWRRSITEADIDDQVSRGRWRPRAAAARPSRYIQSLVHWKCGPDIRST